MSLKKLEEELSRDLELLQYPPKPWLASGDDSYDVVIVGAGMGGLAVAFSLMREGISNITVLDENPSGLEGPWITYARMLILRSGKTLAGPAVGLPKLTFQAWYIAKYGEVAWERLYKIDTPIWMEYLIWYRKVLKIPVKNNCKVTDIKPQGGLIEIEIEGGKALRSRKVVLATGRSGFGGNSVPHFIKGIPKEFYAFSADTIDFAALEGKTVGVVGVGASGFDAAAAALECGAHSVTMLTRRKKVPHVNKFASVFYPGFGNGFFNLPDKAKIEFIKVGFDEGGLPPFESLDRLLVHKNFKVLTNQHIKHVSVEDKKIIVECAEKLEFDFLILATGFEVDGSKESVLKSIFADVLLWKDKHEDISAKMGKFPYLGNNFQFLSKKVGEGDYLKNIYCFNYAATLSHGLLSGDIPEISTGAIRVAKGIVSDFFVENWPLYLQRLKDYKEDEFVNEDYSFIKLPSHLT